MIAMALANRPDLLIADEPTTALDVTVQAQILQLIKDLKARYGMAVILITHDLTIVRAFSQYVYVMKDGEVKEHNRTEEVFSNPKHPYTQHLLASEPKGVANPLAEDTATILEGRGVSVVYKLKRGGMFRPDYLRPHRRRQPRHQSAGGTRRSAWSANPGPARRPSARR